MKSGERVAKIVLYFLINTIIMKLILLKFKHFENGLFRYHLLPKSVAMSYRQKLAELSGGPGNYELSTPCYKNLLVFSCRDSQMCCVQCFRSSRIFFF